MLELKLRQEGLPHISTQPAAVNWATWLAGG